MIIYKRIWKERGILAKNIVAKWIKHFNLINRHKWVVFKLCCKAGIPFRGLVHDLSKYSPVEFFESARFYNSSMSPILLVKRRYGYSKAWLHHKGRNKHHPEYWYDPRSRNPKILIPYKYTVEMICDNLAAGMIYNGKKWNNKTQIKFWEKRKENVPMNEKNKELLTAVFTEIGEKGMDPVLNKKYLKELYKKYCE